MGGRSNKCNNSMIQFQTALDDCLFDDLGFKGPTMTWNNRRDDLANVQERLDRAVATTSWK